MNDETTESAAEVTATEDAEPWQVAKIVGTEEEAAMAVGFLNNNGIEAQVESLHASEFPTDFGHLGEVHVMVPPGQLAEAQRLLAQIEAEAAAAPADSDSDSDTESAGE
jgi:hypothetical protein